MKKTLSLNVDLLIEIIAVAKEANLFGTTKVGVRYVWKKIHSRDTPYGTMFTEDRMRKLAPVLLHAFAPEHREKVGHSIFIKIPGLGSTLHDVS